MPNYDEIAQIKTELVKLKAQLYKGSALVPALEKYYSYQTAHDLIMHQNRSDLMVEARQLGYLALASAKKICPKNMPDGNTAAGLPKATD